MPTPYYPTKGTYSAPGVPGPVQQVAAPPNPWSSPQGMYEHIIASVPGISPAGASYLQAQLLGGGNIMDPLRGQQNGLTLAQINSIGGLLMAGADSHQPVQPGDVPGPQPVAPPPTSSGIVPGGPPNTGVPQLPRQPVPPYDASSGLPPTYDQIGISQPPPTPMPGWNVPIGPAPPGGIDFGNYAPQTMSVPQRQPAMPPAGGIDYGDYGAHLAESGLGLRLPKILDSNIDLDPVSPVHFLDRVSGI